MGKRHRRSCARTVWLAAHSPVSRSLVEEHPSHGQVFVASKHRILSEIGGHHSRRWVLLLQKELMPFSLFICIRALARVDALRNLLYPRRRKFQMDFRSATTTAFYLRPHNSPRRGIWRFLCWIQRNHWDLTTFVNAHCRPDRIFQELHRELVDMRTLGPELLRHLDSCDSAPRRRGLAYILKVSNIDSPSSRTMLELSFITRR